MDSNYKNVLSILAINAPSLVTFSHRTSLRFFKEEGSSGKTKLKFAINIIEEL